LQVPNGEEAVNLIYKKKVLLSLEFVGLLLAMFFSTPILTEVSASPGTTVYVYPSTKIVSVGQTFVVEIRISDVYDLYGWEFKLSWDPSLLDVTGVTEGEFLKRGGDTFFYSKTNNTAGYILVDCTLLGDISGVSGNGTLATAEFYAETEGTSILDLYDTILINSSEQPIIHTATDGTVDILLPHDVAITSVDASPTAVIIGQTITVTVDAANQGASTETFTVTAYYDSNTIGTQTVTLAAGGITTLVFNWDTTTAATGTYTIKAVASTVPGETDTADNTLTDGTVKILPDAHDIAIVNVAPTKTIVGQGLTQRIQVTIENQGGYNETFNVSVYYNTTNLIATQSVTLEGGSSVTIVFVWDTSAVTKGSYILSAVASLVPEEVDTTDNAYVDGAILVAMAGDISGPDGVPDGLVDIDDVIPVALAFGSKRGDARYEPNCDINDDDLIDIDDVIIPAIHFGEIDP
jgi:hypothetical protein